MTAANDKVASRTLLPRLGRILRIVFTRLRFFAVFVVVFVVISQWETLRVHWKRLITSPRGQSAISADTEFFCPMDPGVFSDWPSKCPICNMTLVRHKKGDNIPLPDGVIARMQFTPYRLWLGGIRTATVDHKALTRTITLDGSVEEASTRAGVRVEGFSGELADVEVGTLAVVSSQTESSRGAVNARVARIESKREGMKTLEIVPSVGDFSVFADRSDRKIRIDLKISADSLNPFKKLPSVPPPIESGEPRQIYHCMDHREITSLIAGTCPKDQSALMLVRLRENERVGWWCPAHPAMTSAKAGRSCELCGGMALVPRRVSYRRPGTTLSVPAEAVISDGVRSLVYCDVGAGMFDARPIEVGPRFGLDYPVISGLEPGDLVAAQGAFLIDAETRLNPGVAAGYFGSSTPAAKSAPAKNESWLEELPPADRPAAVAQKKCPVTGKPLGSMGTPPKISLKGLEVFLCCEGCRAAIEKDPERFLKAIPTGKTGGSP